MDEERRLYFQCVCGFWSRDLDTFLPHASWCHGVRARERERQHRIDVRREASRQRHLPPHPWRVGHYQSRMLGILPTVARAQQETRARRGEREDRGGGFPLHDRV